MSIEYLFNKPVTADQFIELLRRSRLSERRPVQNRVCMEGMVANSNLMVTAWDGDELVGIARSMTDFHYACYLSDLAVDLRYQNQGVGRELQIRTRTQLGPDCKIILLAAPAANSYYESLGYAHNPRAWVLEPDQVI